MKTVVFAAGGTAGHVFMAVGIAQHLKTPKILITDERGKKYAGDVFDEVYVLPLKARNFGIPFLKSLFITFKVLKKRDSVFFGCGAYTSLIVGLISIMLRKQMFIYQGDQVVGRANRFLHFFCKKSFVSTDYLNSLYYVYDFRGILYSIFCFILFKFFVWTNLPKVFSAFLIIVMTGPLIFASLFPYPTPIKNFNPNDNNRWFSIKSIRNGEVVGVISRKEIVATPLPEGQFTILILGGSLGSSSLGKLIMEVLEEMPREVLYKIHIIQQKFRGINLDEFYESMEISYESHDFVDTAKELPRSHLVISRAGWGTISDLVTAKRAAIFIPWPKALDNHQLYNVILLPGRVQWYLEEDRPTDYRPFDLKELHKKRIIQMELHKKRVIRMRFLIKNIINNFYEFGDQSKLFKHSQYSPNLKTDGGKTIAEYLNNQFYMLE